LLTQTVSCKTLRVWCLGRVGGIVKTMCAICCEFRRIKCLLGTPVHFCMHNGTSRLVYEATSQVRDFRRLWVEKSRSFPSGKHYKQRLDRWGFPVTILLRNVNKMCVCQPIQRYRHVVQFVLKTAEHNIRIETEQATYFGLCQVLTKNAKQPTHNIAVWQTSTDCLISCNTYWLTYLLTELLTDLLHGTESFWRS